MDLDIYSLVLDVFMLHMLTDSSVCSSSWEQNASTERGGWRSPLSMEALWKEPCIRVKSSFGDVTSNAQCRYQEGPSSRILVQDPMDEGRKSQDDCDMVASSRDVG